MTVRTTVAVCVFALLFSVSSLAIQPNIVSVPKRVQKLSDRLNKFGTGEQALVAARLRDKTAVSGYISEVGRDYMMVVDTKTGEEQKVSLYKVARLQGYNIQTRKEVHDGTGLGGKLARLGLKVLPGHDVPQHGLSEGKAIVVGIIIGVLLAIVLAAAL